MEDNTTTTTTKKRVRYEDDTEIDTPETKRIRDDLLNILEDTDSAVDKNSATQDLASFMKIFEEEISIPLQPLPAPETALEVTALSVSGESQPDLGYLLEASDDELGLPPSSSNSGELGLSSDVVGLDQIWGFDDEIPSYDSFGFEFSEGNENNDNYDEFFAAEGLFDYSNVFCESSDFSEYSWRPESLPAL